MQIKLLSLNFLAVLNLVTAVLPTLSPAQQVSQTPPASVLGQVVITAASPGHTFVKGIVKWDQTPVPGSTVSLTVKREDGSEGMLDSELPIRDSSFITSDPVDLRSGDQLFAQIVNRDGKRSHFSARYIVPELCHSNLDHDLEQPTFFISSDEENDVQIRTVIKNIGKDRIIKVLVCGEDHLAIATLTPAEQSAANETSFGSKHLLIAAGKKVYLDASTASSKYVTSKSEEVPEFNALTGDYRVALVGGIEVGGYSSQAQNTNAFVQAFVESPYRRFAPHFYASTWGRVRLLGAASPSTSGIGSTFTDPSGTVTKQDFSSIGQALDYVAGVQIALRPESTTFGRVSLIAGSGATTPLSAEQTPLTFKAPAYSTSECASLIKKFALTDRGYLDGSGFVDPVTMKVSQQCLQSKDKSTAIKDIAFANQDRSNFLGRWGAGVRAVGTQNCAKGRTQCADALALLDLTLGQDAALTGGQLRNFVVKFDGLLPIRTGDAAYLYLFGSAYTRIVPNRNDDPLILAAETTKPALPDPSVIVLPFLQPNRDYYRLGVGLNLQQIFCKLGTKLCDTTAK